MKVGKTEQYKIALILEGDEEACLFDIAFGCEGIDPIFDLLPINAGGAGNVAPYFQDYYTNPAYDYVVAVYDVDGKADEPGSVYLETKRQLLDILATDKAVSAVSFCTNPNILQMLLMGCDKPESVCLSSTAKGENAEIVSRYWPKIKRKKDESGRQIKGGYNASAWQLEIIKSSYIYDQAPSYSYESLLCNALQLSTSYETDMPASNVQLLLKALKDGDVSFFESINKKIGKH